MLDYDKLNSERLKPSHGLDVRIDKRLYFDKWSFNFYIDIQNIYNFQSELPSYIDVNRDAANAPIISGDNPNSYETKYVSNTAGTVLPSLGIMIQF